MLRLPEVLRNTGGAASTAPDRAAHGLFTVNDLSAELGLCVRGTCRAVSQEMSSPIAPDTAARDAATPAGAHVAATTLLVFLAFLATPAAAQDTHDDSPIGQSAGASQSVAATVTCSSKPGERSSCAADTSKGVVLLRSTGDAPCLLGRSWGYDQTSVWVSDGCSAEFVHRRCRGTGDERSPSPSRTFRTSASCSWTTTRARSISGSSATRGI